MYLIIYNNGIRISEVLLDNKTTKQVEDILTIAEDSCDKMTIEYKTKGE